MPVKNVIHVASFKTISCIVLVPIYATVEVRVRGNF